MRKVLVTGASGFVGTHLIEALAARGIETTAICYSSKPQSSHASGGSATWVKADLIKEDIDDLLSGVDTIFHLSGYAGLGSDVDTAKRLNSINVTATERVANAALRSKSRLIYVSSIHAGDATAGQQTVDETNGVAQTEYGRSKRRAEQVLESLGDQSLDFTVLRPTQLFGEYHRGSVYDLAVAIQRRRFFLIGDGNNATNFYYVRDFVQVLLRAAESTAARNKIYIAAADPVSLRDLAEEMSAQLGVTLRDLEIPREVGLFLGGICDAIGGLLRVDLPLTRQRVRVMTRDVRYSNRKLASDIGEPVCSGTLTGLSRTIEWYRSIGLLV